MPKASSKTTPKSRKTKKKDVQEQTKTPQCFRDIATDAKKKQEKFTKSDNTNTNYASMLKRGRAWAKDFAGKTGDAEKLWNESRCLLDILDVGDDNDAEDDDDPEYETMPDDFATCLDGKPTSTTPRAIALFMYSKCFDEECGKSTAWAIFSAFKRNYDNMAQDMYRGPWKEDKEGGKWVGNPTSSAWVKDMLTACKNKDGEKERKHSRAMSHQDMKAIYDWSIRTCPDDAPVTNVNQLALKTEHLLYRASASLAFTIWTRHCETTNLKGKHIDMNPEPHPGAAPYEPTSINVHLKERKGWQKKMNKGQSQLNGHLYRLYPQPETPEIDAKERLQAWKSHYEKHLLCRDLGDDDYLFPSVGSNGISVQFAIPISADSYQRKVNEFAAAAGLPGAGKYTTHCFRRGGAQYRFMYAPVGQRWTLARIRWWGGWAPSERRDTLVRYLLDELYTYKQDHSDALCPINLERSESHMGEAAETAPLTVCGAKVLFNEIKALVQDPRPPPFPPYYPFPFPYSYYPNPNYHSPAIYSQPDPVARSHALQDTKSYSPLYPPGYSLSPFQSSVQYPDPSWQIPTVTGHGTPIVKTPQPIPDAPFLPVVPKMIPGQPRDTAYKQVIKDWQEADPSRHHMFALKDWKPEWYNNQKLAMNYHHRKKIALEFIETYGSDEQRFCDAYPEHSRGIKALYNAIHTKQIEEGRAKPRVKRAHQSLTSGSEGDRMDDKD
ncbi:hypothetical protein K435DRAFT_874378 [Dendrothele bispora CBS 962.96]|uniref:DNA breaking-rejoining enzyme n=1 Tax=Dendrothele bispora (strain CBS 962.96) TaxID=1314807 RepID=A0A4S8KX75_DENBC|nr:hypothetical protein K435DRAFT_874378 [Dendrothele bispora CBS 962.96]